MKNVFSDRILNTHKSFIREILKVTQKPQMISFAGGLPNPAFFPVEKTAEAAFKVLNENGAQILQYTTTEGYYPLRELIADRYAKRGIKVDPEEILITNGSQQALDLIGKIFINKGERVVIEKPGYLGAIQALGLYEPEFVPVDLLDDGIDMDRLTGLVKDGGVKLIYTVPNFQNPSGKTYSRQRREEIASLLAGIPTIFVEDDAYGELRFIGENVPPVWSFSSNNTILTGSFSKIVAPGLRLGWICAGKEIMEKLITAKQASDLHSNHLSQWIVYRYLTGNNIDLHISLIREGYKEQRDAMVSCLDRQLEGEVEYTRPQGGMFLWMTLPDGLEAMKLFDLALERNVAFVPGSPFYVDGGGRNTLRLNYTNSNTGKIDEGISVLAGCIRELVDTRKPL